MILDVYAQRNGKLHRDKIKMGDKYISNCLKDMRTLFNINIVGHKISRPMASIFD